MASTSRPSLTISFFVLILLSFSLCSGRLLHGNFGPPSPPSYVNAVHNHDHGNFKDNFVRLMARLFRSERFLRQEDHEYGTTTILNVDDFGAIGNGNDDDTEAFKNAWKKACSSRGVTVLVVPQKEYLLKQINFQGPCKSNNLTLQIQGTLEASDKRSDYVLHSWLLFESVENLSVEGGGTLDGNGDVWWKHSCKHNKSLPCTGAPTGLTFHKCDNLIVRDLTVRNAAQMQIAFEKCKKVKASHLTVAAPGNSPNTDGIHITHTQDIEISNSDIGTGDDCISIVNESQNIRATDIICGPGHGISIGSLGGGNSEAHVSDIVVDRAKFHGTTNGVRIKTWQGGSGSASNMKFVNIEMDNVHNPIIIDQNYCDRKEACKEKKSSVQVRDIIYKNITGTSASEVAIKFDCSRIFKCEDIVLQDVDIRPYLPKDHVEAFCKNVELTDIGVVTPHCNNSHQGRNHDHHHHHHREGGNPILPPVQPPPHVHDHEGGNSTPPLIQPPYNPTLPPVQPPSNEHDHNGGNPTLPPLQPPHDPAPPPVQPPQNPTLSPVQPPQNPIQPPVQPPQNLTLPPVQPPSRDDHDHKGGTLTPSVQQPVFSVDDFGAKGNGVDDTEAFKNAWEKACSSKVATFLVVPQKNYLVKPIRFNGPCKSNVTIQIYGTVEASDDRSDYSELGRHWLLFDSVNNLVIEGGGTLNGNGDKWWKHSCKINRSLPCMEAPTALTFHNCEKLEVRNLKIKDAQQIQVSFDHCKHVRASNLNITAPEDSPNTDGIHVTHTQDIEISNCVIETGDDCISIVSGSQKVRANDITCGPGHGISIGSLGRGNAESHVSDVIVRKAKLSGTMNGVRIKTWQGGSGSASNIKFIDIEMDNVHNPIIVDQNYCDQKNPCKPQGSAVKVKDVLYQNIKGTSSSDVAIRFDCSQRFMCEGIVIRDIDLQSKTGHHQAEAYCNNVKFTEILDDVSPRLH